MSKTIHEKTTDCLHLDFDIPVMDESDEIEILERKVSCLIRAGNSIVRAQTQVEKNQAIHDWVQLLKKIQK